MKHLPLFLDINQQECLVIGGGTIAARKVTALLDAGGNVTVIAPQLCEGLQRRATENSITFASDSFPYNDFERHLKHAILVVAATNQRQINLDIAQQATKAGKLANIADNPSDGNFVLPSVIDQDPLLIAISTSGTSPVLNRLIKTRIVATLPRNIDRLATLMGENRRRVKSLIPDLSEQRRFWEFVCNGRIADLISHDCDSEAHAMFSQLCDDYGKPDIGIFSDGEICLINAGPGDLDLISLRSLRLLQQTEVVIYSQESEHFLGLCRSDCEFIRVQHYLDHTDERKIDIKGDKRNKNYIAAITRDLEAHTLNGKRASYLTTSGDPGLTEFHAIGRCLLAQQLAFQSAPEDIE